jgi:hypothetical protein
MNKYYLVLAALNEEQVDKMMTATEEKPTDSHMRGSRRP